MNATLPEPLLHAAEAELSGHDRTAMRNAADALSRSYRGQQAISRTLSPIGRAAYLAVRFPSTFAAARVVWREVAELSALEGVQTVLDVGAGPGTASLAAAEVLNKAQFTLLERDAGWRETANRLARAIGARTTFQPGALPCQIAAHDVVFAGYALNELAASDLSNAIALLWAAARKALIILEPGTPKGFAVTAAARTQALAAGAHAAAPCTHDDTCPMSTADWCHQPVRLTRSASHRWAKQGALGFEDEKFSYIVLTRAKPRRLAPARIVRKPIRNQGHVHLDLCAGSTIQRTTVARSDKGIYRQARDADWGDLWPPDQAGG